MDTGEYVGGGLIRVVPNLDGFIDATFVGELHYTITDELSKLHLRCRETQRKWTYDRAQWGAGKQSVPFLCGNLLCQLVSGFKNGKITKNLIHFAAGDITLQSADDRYVHFQWTSQRLLGEQRLVISFKTQSLSNAQKYAAFCSKEDEAAIKRWIARAEPPKHSTYRSLRPLSFEESLAKSLIQANWKFFPTDYEKVFTRKELSAYLTEVQNEKGWSVLQLLDAGRWPDKMKEDEGGPPTLSRYAQAYPLGLLRRMRTPEIYAAFLYHYTWILTPCERPIEKFYPLDAYYAKRFEQAIVSMFPKLKGQLIPYSFRKNPSA